VLKRAGLTLGLSQSHCGACVACGQDDNSSLATYSNFTRNSALENAPALVGGAMVTTKASESRSSPALPKDLTRETRQTMLCQPCSGGAPVDDVDHLYKFTMVDSLFLVLWTI
jgi:hypothetical protein